MHAIKVGWVGQTFALAKCNESEGRKSRIRRSKEERKELVVSFIQKYQSSHSGSFPSLNITHKEVGGSFYTVREIVREVIQENRVLGPAKLTPDEQKLLNDDQFLEQYALGSISYEPQISLNSSPNGTHFVPDYQGTSGEVYVLTSGRVINGSQVDIKSEGADDVKCIELQASEPLEAKNNLEEEMVVSRAKENPLVSEPSEAKENLEEVVVASKAKVNPLVPEPSEAKENLEEEMLASKAKVNSLVREPSKAKENSEEEVVASKAIVDLQACEPSEEKVNVAIVDLQACEPSEEKVNVEEEMVASKAKVNPLVRETSVVKMNIEEKTVASKAKLDPLATDVIVETFPLRPLSKPTLDAKSGELRGSISTLEKTAVEKVRSGQLGRSSFNSVDNSGLVGKDVKKDVDPFLQNSNCSTTKESHNDGAVVFHNGAVEANDRLQTVAEVKAIDAPNGTYNHKSGKELVSEEAKTIASDDKAEVQPTGSSKKGITPTLNRINLESWEGPSKTSAEAENPVLAIFKSFVAAFVKFWSAD